METLLNLYAFSLPLLLFLYWTIIGYAMLSLLHTQRNLLLNLLMAPIMGVVITLLPVFELNRLGLPIGYFASVLAICLLISSCFILWWRKPLFPLREYLPFIGIFTLALILTGRPLLQFGFDWISFANSDTGHYCLGALRVLHHGFFDVPRVSDLLQGNDYSLFYWFFSVVDLVRSGSEQMIAWTSGVTHLSCQQVFMPLILSFHLILISSTGALLFANRVKYRIAILACLLLTFSSLTTLGTLYQMISQVLGLSLLIMTVILLLQPFNIHKKFFVFSNAILTSFAVSAFLIVYPELTPFLFMGFILYFCLLAFKGWLPNKAFFITLGITALLVIIIMNIHLPVMIKLLLIQIHTGSSQQNISLFPYFFLPDGPANFWGFLGITQQTFTPWKITAFYWLSRVFGVLAICATIFLLRGKKIFISAAITFIMVIIGISLFKNSAGFGLFKLAMDIQPFLMCIVAISLYQFIKSKIIRTGVVSLLLIIGLCSLNYYVLISGALRPEPFIEVVYGSNTKISQQLHNAIEQLPADTIFLSDDFNSSLLFMQAFQTLHHPLIFLSSPGLYAYGIGDPYSVPFLRNRHTLIGNMFVHILDLDNAQAITQHFKPLQLPTTFNLDDPRLPSIDFLQVAGCETNAQCANKAVLIADTALRSTINRRHYLPQNNLNFRFEPYKNVKNHLVFTLSTLNYHSQLNNDNLNSVSLYNLESDPFAFTRSMQALGHFLLFRIVNPSQSFRLVTHITNSFSGNGDNTIPSVTVIGNSHSALPVMGRGSARVVSSPLSARLINHIPYIVLDTYGKKTPLQQTTVNGIPLDTRQIITYARDISLITEKEYQAMKPPIALKAFPHDLYNPDLEYSGIYEDGWISENAFFTLRQPNIKTPLIVEGNIPKIDNHFSQTSLTISLNGKTIAQRILKTGDFSFNIPLKEKFANKDKIELHFDKTQLLPNGDGRPVAALIKFVGFAGKDENEVIDLNVNAPSVVQHFPDDLQNSDIEFSGIYADGWVKKYVSLLLKAPDKTSFLIIEGTLPRIALHFSGSTINIAINGNNLYQKFLPPGHFKLQIPVSNLVGNKRIDITFDKEQKLPPGDNRLAAAVIKFIGFA